MEKKKLKIGFISNSPLIKTGLSRNIKAFLPILYRKNKYEIFMLNQSIGDGEPNFQRFPWKNEGAMKNFDQNRFNQDQGYQRFVAYGNGVVEDWVTKNRLDVVLALDDPWAFDLNVYVKSDWYQHIKQNFLFDITLDSEPIIPHAKELAKNCPNFCVWSSFAEKALKRENPELYGHVRTLRGSIDKEQFKPIHKEERIQLRHKFGIDDNEKIIIYLGRNQLRKNAFHANQEALAIFKKKYPNKKIRLLFHTNFSEPMGWPIDQIRDELELKKEDILCTYYCRTCQDWNIQPHDGEDIDCSHCKSSRSRITAGIGSTISEEDLNRIYNIADASCSVFTSGGQEYTNVESMLAGIPLACPKYSSGEDFVLSGYVYEIKGTFYREHNTSFKKFTPNINSIVEFYEYIWNLSEEKRKELVKKGREWAIKEFDAENIANQIETFIDSCKSIDWDSYFNRKRDVKNVNAQVEDKQIDDEFVTECYQKLLNMNPTSGDEGRIHWNRYLAQPRDKGQLKQEMINCFKNAAIQHNQKVLPPTTIESLLDKDDKSRVLLVLEKSIGDLYLLTSLLPEIKEKYPDSSIYIGCDPKYFDIFDCNPYVKRCVPWIPQMDNELWCCGQGNHKGYFSVSINVGISTQKILNYLTNKY